ncbi:MAG: hypothetical protein CVV44_17195 [Spirochaetae bacterium HGW-Spirochaetae-1]|jgi:flagellar motor component MotA|nr:MAG: hypothetical protein CVV44_17195 [Spirochaetae bacterium HGW-Spirochaetae-1]
MKKSYMAYAPLTLGVFAAGILIGGADLRVFWDPPSLMIVFLPVIFLLLSVFGPSGIVDAFRAAFDETPSKSEVLKGIAFFSMATRIILLSGFMGTLMGVLMTLYGISKSQDIPVAFYIVIASQTVCYAVVMVLIVTVPFKSALEKKLAALSL